MKQLELTIRNQTGLHARPAKVLVNLAKQFKCDIRIQCKQKRANAKSMVSVLTLGATRGSVISIEATGEDEELALVKLEEAILSGLGDVDHAEDSASTPGETSAPPEPNEIRPDASGMLKGISAAPGIAVGPVFHYQALDLSHENLDSFPGDGRMTLEQALSQAKQQLAVLHQQMSDKKLNAEAAIFEAHGEFLEDQDLLEGVKAHMEAGLSTVRAWKTTVDERAEAIAALGDTLLSARADDLRDVGHRVLRLLLSIPETGIVLPETPVVVLARELSPSDTVAFDPERVLGFAIVNGGPTSHIAILARALGLPAIVGVDESMLALADQTPVILNGNDGTLIPNPEPEVLQRFEQEQQRWLERRRNAREQAELPAITLDGRRVEVTANAGSHADAVQAMKMSADGIGLLRTEFLFLDRATAPSEEEQFSVYRAIAETMRPRPVIVRTLDVGGDKPLAYIHLKPEANPFLGERGIRLCLNHPELFREQLRAILRAAPHGQLQIMFPMVSDVSEVRQARALVEELRQELQAPAIPIGIMIEVPSAALLADKLAPEVDFFSIGTNDLTQYTLAMDRGHAGLAARQDGLHPAVLRLIARTAEAAHQYGKRVDVCGELGSDAAAIPILIGLGVDELSVSIPAVPTVKAQVRTLSLARVQPLARQALDCTTAAEVRELVRSAFA
jgi:multiphosphoryl transfer protein